ncbi:MAG: hypothetical protein J0M10_19025 [Chitinophagales bacterium]|nr:hypothetical protein [Chitinophagales bacterium]
MIKKYSLLAVLAVFCLYVSGQSPVATPDCAAFRTGDYLYTDTANITWTLKRTKHRQVQKSMRTGAVIKFKIMWLSSCEYRLTQVWTSDRSLRKWNRANFSYQIVGTTAGSYTYSCICKGSPSIQGTVVRAVN